MQPILFEKNQLEPLFARAYAGIDRSFRTRFWQVKLVFLATCLAFVMQTPRYTLLYRYAVSKVEINEGYNNFVKQVNAPFQLRHYPEYSHESKMAFRLLAPLLVKILRIPPIGIFGIQFILGLAMYVCIIRLFENITHDRVATVLFTLGLSCTYFGSAYLADLAPYFDSFSYAILVFLLISTRPVLVGLLAFAGALNDERTLIALPIVALWYVYGDKHRPLSEPFNWMQALKSLFTNWKVLFLILGVMAYIVVRLFIIMHYHLIVYKGFVGLESLRYSNEKVLLEIGLMSGLESFWAVLGGGALVLLAKKYYKLCVCMIGAILPSFIASFMVLDITRSLAYITPICFLNLIFLYQSLKISHMRHFAAIVLCASFIIPTISIRGNTFASINIFSYVLKLIL